MTTGKINVSVENIFPLIKKFLYNDHEIFLRELVSNATDATLKLKHLTSIGEAKVEYGNPIIEVKIDKEGIEDRPLKYHESLSFDDFIISDLSISKCVYIFTNDIVFDDRPPINITMHSNQLS